MNLRTKLLIFSFIIALIPLAIAGNSMIQITRNELKSTANDRLMKITTQVIQNIEDFYRYKWLAPLELIKTAIDNPNLGVREKINLMTGAMKSVPDVVALQLSVQGFPEPLIVNNDLFSSQLKSAGLDPIKTLKLPFDRIETLRNNKREFAGDLTYLPKVNKWLITVILLMDPKTFGKTTVFSARIDLGSLSKRINDISYGESVSISLIDRNGKKMFDPKAPDLTKFAIVRNAIEFLNFQNLSTTVESYVRPDGQKILGGYGFPSFLDFVVIVEQSEDKAYEAVTKMGWSLVAWLIGGFAIAVAGAIVVSVSLTRPLTRLTRAARIISEGDLTIRLEYKERKDEIGELSGAFNKMVRDLRDYINKLTETTKAKERTESELKLARTIQQSFLPKEFPKLQNVDVYGKCEPAREVGGDYFDFFKLDNGNYGLVIGDVSGKGIPAALFMAVSRTLFRILSAQLKSPEQVLTEFNDQLVALDQGSNMFITMFYGEFCPETGRLTYSTAGHNMPFIRLTQDKDSEGLFKMLPNMPTMVAGMMDGMEMHLAEVQLNEGDAIVLYTDGMTEAVDVSGEEFGEERLGELLNKYVDLPAEQLCEKLIHDVLVFQTGQPQFDDMTLLVLKMKSNQASQLPEPS